MKKISKILFTTNMDGTGGTHFAVEVKPDEDGNLIIVSYNGVTNYEVAEMGFTLDDLFEILTSKRKRETTTINLYGEDLCIRFTENKYIKVYDDDAVKEAWNGFAVIYEIEED